MKTIRLLGMALTAIIISVSLSACGDDDSDSPETPVNPEAKHITRVVQEKDDGDKTEFIYNYDSQGRVIAMMEQETNKTRVSNSYLYTFTYNGNTITVNEEDKYIYTYSLLDGRITSLRSEYKYSTSTQTRVTSYSYDAQGHLKSMDEDDNNKTCTWSGGDLTEMNQTYQERDGERHYWYKIDYNSDTAPANYMHIGLFDGRETALVMMGYFGKMPTHLIREITRHHADGDYETSTLTYQIQEGRPVKIDFTQVSLHDNNPGTPDFGKITLEWN
jgi:YD repeat-containing protein